MIARRDFLFFGAAAVALPLHVSAQTARKPVIGVLFHSNPEPTLGILRNALQNLGYREGETIQIEVRVADGSNARLDEMAADLVTRKVDVIVAITTPAALASKAATQTIPIVMGAVADAVGSGLVASLARPGGNITGVSGAVSELAGKTLGLLREAVPSASRIGVLLNASDPYSVRLLEGIEAANVSAKADLQIFKIMKPDQVEAAFATMAAGGIGAAIIQPTLPLPAVIALAFRHRLPTASPIRGYAEAGGLLSYAGHSREMLGVAAGQIDQILKGAKPADIAVRQPTRFELILNLKTAKALDLVVPPLLLAQADVVIE
jgi:putative tryptophan/tyrosine transport system substrate-binding protein